MIGDLINDFRKAMEGKIMENIAIKGHATRGSEVIELLRMLGGVNVDSHKGSFPDEWKSSYYIYGDNTIQFARDEFLLKLNFVIFTLEEFLEKYPYKVGDKVILIDSLCTITKMWWDDINGEILYEVQGKKFVVNCDANSLLPYKEEKTFPPYMDYDITTTKEEEDMKEININRIGFNGDKVRLILPNGYEFKVEGNEVFVIKKKPKYPKTYDKCCDILGVEDRENGYCGYEYELLGKFQKLFICRNAYWKIAGEELGLNKPWKPDWYDDDWSDMYYISFDGKNINKETGFPCCNVILIFPTEEMRDAFHENFKDLIEECKELL